MTRRTLPRGGPRGGGVGVGGKATSKRGLCRVVWCKVRAGGRTVGSLACG